MRKFIVEAGNLDENNDQIKIDGVKIPEKVLLMKDFDPKKPIGHCKVFIEDDVLKAKIDVPEDLLNLYPSVAYQAIAVNYNDKGHFIVGKCKLLAVLLSETPNADPTIKTIKEQNN